MATTVFNRFRVNSVAGRMLTTLAKGPKTPLQVAKIAKVRSADNIMAGGGWYFQLRRFGKASRKFDLSAVDGKLVLTVNKRFRSQVA